MYSPIFVATHDENCRIEILIHQISQSNLIESNLGYLTSVSFHFAYSQNVANEKIDS